MVEDFRWAIDISDYQEIPDLEQECSLSSPQKYVIGLLPESAHMFRNIFLCHSSTYYPSDYTPGCPGWCRPMSSSNQSFMHFSVPRRSISFWTMGDGTKDSDTFTGLYRMKCFPYYVPTTCQLFTSRRFKRITWGTLQMVRYGRFGRKLAFVVVLGGFW
jgi:hypothetical protein